MLFKRNQIFKLCSLPLKTKINVVLHVQIAIVHHISHLRLEPVADKKSVNTQPCRVQAINSHFMCFHPKIAFCCCTKCHNVLWSLLCINRINYVYIQSKMFLVTSLLVRKRFGLCPKKSLFWLQKQKKKQKKRQKRIERTER